jgi:riboflavin kinase
MSFVILTLKALALKGATSGTISISTLELGKELGVSQQTASNRIRALLDKGLIERNLGTKGQRIRITTDGVGLLMKELAHYQKIFDREEGIRITGTVSAGLGDGEYYLKRQEYKKQIKAKLGFVPYEGTLNLKVSDDELPKLDILPESKTVNIDGFQAEGRTFGSATCFPVKLKGVDCAIVLPKRTHHTQVLEVISATYLRGKFDLEDGDEVTLDIEI